MNITAGARDRAALRRRLLHWFDAHKRDLPWRRTRDPYAIWVAEIMLQQTRAAAVLEHYREFLHQFPTVKVLAKAKPSRVLAAWSGLGYYRRARALQEAARRVRREFGGRIPETEHELEQLPGIGRYTAAAIASTAFDRPCAVVDGNVERVLTRLLGNSHTPWPRLWAVAEGLLSRRRPGDFNQAMMELGAVVCLPATPRCDACPLRAWCATRGSLPTVAKQIRRKQHVRYLLAAAKGRVFLVQRPGESSLMPAMWELPPADEASLPRAPRCSTAAASHATSEMVLRHSITNTDYSVTVVRGRAPAMDAGRWVSVSQLGQLPLTGLARKILRRAVVSQFEF